MRFSIFLCALSGCAGLRQEAQLDGHFRRALLAQLRGGEAEAEEGYQRVLALSPHHGATLNNLAVLAVRRHSFIEARRYLRHAVTADGDNLVSLTNYGVVCYHLADLGPAREALEEARRRRQQRLDETPYQSLERYRNATAPLDRVAQSYLTRIEAEGERPAGRRAGAEARPLHVMAAWHTN